MRPLPPSRALQLLAGSLLLGVGVGLELGAGWALAAVGGVLVLDYGAGIFRRKEA